jgi:DNA-binding Lrp family transcriptional regulator
MLTEIEKKVIRGLQRDLPVSPRPFLEIAQELGLTEEVLTGVIQKLIDQGYIRRFGATIRHRISGFQANAMAAWAVPREEVPRVGPHGRGAGGDPLLRAPGFRRLAV